MRIADELGALARGRDHAGFEEIGVVAHFQCGVGVLLGLHWLLTGGDIFRQFCRGYPSPFLWMIA